MLIRDHTVYSIFQSSTLAYTVQKLLASTYIELYVLVIIQDLHTPANSHRLFVISETPGSASPPPGVRGNLSGVVSIVDGKKSSHVYMRRPVIDSRDYSPLTLCPRRQHPRRGSGENATP